MFADINYKTKQYDKYTYSSILILSAIFVRCPKYKVTNEQPLDPIINPYKRPDADFITFYVIKKSGDTIYD